MNGPRRRRGAYIALEGIDGAGKSTLLAALGRSMRRRGLSVRLRREPADRALGRLAQEAGASDPWTGAVYFTVDRHLAAPRLKADLRRFDLVLSDRSYYSTVAYQGSRLSPRERTRLEELQRQATVRPDGVLLLDLPAGWLRRRIRGRATARGPLERTRSLGRVARAYRELARRGGWAVLDAREPPREVLRQAVLALASWGVRGRPSARGKTLRGSRGPRRAG